MQRIEAVCCLLFCQFIVMNFVAHAEVCACVYKQFIWTKAT